MRDSASRTNQIRFPTGTISELTPGNSDKPASADLVDHIGLPKLGTGDLIDHETFESIYHPGKLLLLASWMDAVAADQWKPKISVGGNLRHRQVRIIRDYGMVDRREAPQYYPSVV